MKQKTVSIILLTFALVIGLGAVALALGGDPQTLFMDNITATGPSLAVTKLGQELLNRLNAATTSIDAAIYSFDRVSIRDALIAAHNRGVTVRIVAEGDDVYHDYNPSYVALQAPVFLSSSTAVSRSCITNSSRRVARDTGREGNVTRPPWKALLPHAR